MMFSCKGAKNKEHPPTLPPSNFLLQARDLMIEKLKLKNASFKTQVARAEAEARAKEETGEVLHYIDFHQLQVIKTHHASDTTTTSTTIDEDHTMQLCGQKPPQPPLRSARPCLLRLI